MHALCYIDVNTVLSRHSNAYTHVHVILYYIILMYTHLSDILIKECETCPNQLDSSAYIFASLSSRKFNKYKFIQFATQIPPRMQGAHFVSPSLGC